MCYCKGGRCVSPICEEYKETIIVFGGTYCLHGHAYRLGRFIEGNKTPIVGKMQKYFLQVFLLLYHMSNPPPLQYFISLHKLFKRKHYSHPWGVGVVGVLIHAHTSMQCIGPKKF